MKDRFQRAGGAAALIASLTYLFALALAATVLAAMTKPELGFEEYLGLHRSHGTLIYAWHFAMYLVNGVCLTILALALRERLKDGAPALSGIATAFGLIWTAFVFLSGLLTIHGDAAVLGLAARDPGAADTLRRTIGVLSLAIDSSDRLLGCLWVGLVSFVAMKARALPAPLAYFGLALGATGILGTAFPFLLALSYVFGLGVMFWWIWLGTVMLRGAPRSQGAPA